MVELEVAPPTRDVREIIDDVTAEMRVRLDDTTTVVSEAIHSHVDGLSDDIFLSTKQSTRANLGLITTMLSEGTEPTGFAAPEEALSYARSYVHEGLTLEHLTRAYRQGQKAYSRIVLEALKERATDADKLCDAMGYFSDWLFSYIEWMNFPLSEVYTAEHERWIRGSVAMRAEEVRSILSGSRVDVTEASGRLRYRLDGHHVGFVIWDDASEGCDTGLGDGALFGEMEIYAGEVASVLGATSSLALPHGRHYVGWASVPADVRTDQIAIPNGQNGLRVAVGRTARGLEGFRRTHKEAQMARRIAGMMKRSSSACTSFDAVALDSLIMQDADEAKRFVADELGALLDESDANRRLAATLEVFLQEESSFVRAARRLGIHENTVAYRVKRAEELLGRTVSERQLELRTALRLARFG